MGYICPTCGEGLPEDTPCPCTMAGDDLHEDADDQLVIRGPLTAEIASIHSPIRTFLNERFTSGLRDVQRRFREAASPMLVPGAPRTEADPGTVGTAADWLLRFLVHPQPDLQLVLRGAAACQRAGVNVRTALAGIADSLDLPLPMPAPGSRILAFSGPVRGNDADPGLLARACWVLALLTEACRGGPMIAANGPLGQFRGTTVSLKDLLALAPPAGLDQLAGFRHVFETVLLPRLATRIGPWALGPTFTGSALLNADADMIAAGLLLELKTSAKKATLPVTDVLQLIGYMLLDFDDEYHLDEAAIFSAR